MSTRYPEIYLDQPCEFLLDCIEDISAASDVKVYAYHESLAAPQELIYLGKDGPNHILAQRIPPKMKPAGTWRIQPKVWFPDGLDDGYRGRPLVVVVREEGTP